MFIFPKNEIEGNEFYHFEKKLCVVLIQRIYYVF